MIVGNWTKTHRYLWSCLLTVWGVVILAGCGGSSTSEPEEAPSWEGQALDVQPALATAELTQNTSPTPAMCPAPSQNFPEKLPQPRLAGLISVADRLPDIEPASPAQSPPEEASQFWEFSSEAGDRPVLHLPGLVRLPPATEEPPTLAPDISEAVCPEDNRAENDRDADDAEPPVALLPPRPVDVDAAQTANVPQPQPDIPAPILSDSASEVVATGEENASPEARTAELSTDEQELLDLILSDCPAAATGVLTGARLNELATKKIRQGYAMANRGALYSARQEFIEVLRMISRAKDAKHGSARRTLALAAGLRALEEAEDFVPAGTQLEAELDLRVICASHRTPIGRQMQLANVLPQQMMDRYFRYAQLKLAGSVAGEPTGSMALHALGKLAIQLGQVKPEKHRLAQRRAIAFQQAALLAHNQNYLAAHELGVLLAESGHFAEAEHLLQQVAAREPNAIVYQNLARVQQKLGHARQAAATRSQARLLAQRGATGARGIEWVPPGTFSRAGPRSPIGVQNAGLPNHGGPPAPASVHRSALVPPDRSPLPPLYWR